MTIIKPRKLEDKCLSLIEDNFEYYHKIFQVLALAFSETLFCKLKNTGKLRENFLDFFINPHLRNLDIEGIDERFIPYLIRQLAINGRNIISFKANLVEEHLYSDLFPLLPNVEIIEINGACALETMKVIGTYCYHVKVMKAAIQTSRGRYFEYLRAEEYAVICSLLDNCNFLEVLDYSNNGGVANMLGRRHQLDFQSGTLEKCRKYALKSLCFNTLVIPNMANVLKICSVVCPFVSSISLYAVKDHELDLSSFSLLEDIKITIPQIKRNSTRRFLKSSGHNLINFELSHGPMTARSLVKHCPNLQSLTLCSVKFSTIDENKLLPGTSLPNLRKVTLVNVDFSKQSSASSLKLIFSVSKIKNLIVDHCKGLTDGFVNSIFKLGVQNLISLEVSHGPFSVWTFKYCTRLQSLTLSDVNILAFEEKELFPGANPMNLETVILKNVDFSKKFMTSFLKFFSLARNLKNVSVNNCRKLHKRIDDLIDSSSSNQVYQLIDLLDSYSDSSSSSSYYDEFYDDVYIPGSDEEYMFTQGWY